ncbi:hypothetical protein HK103_006915 [Boothiomyces macroporosus]|uniref:Uncharacterized protein n=1 Tax=Boothiomyces macroporosus TaxID=261099 RepID=A0AAD5YAH1_9FUNG|nr:hypothetical protein HK103_006915 [Boothiomyces macroporosus]
MGKSKNPKRNREKPLEHEDMPRKYRQIMNLEKHKIKKQEKQEQQSLPESVNQAQFKQTKKYKKRKEYLNSKKKKETTSEIKEKKDNITFGETVKEPPKITKLPKKKKELSLLDKSRLQKQREFAIQEYRKLKTRERMQKERKKLNLSLK